MTHNTATTVAAFDFDGTITGRDSLLPFLIFAKGRLTAYCLLFLETPAFLRYLTGYSSRQELKERLIKRFFGGEPKARLQEMGRRYAKGTLAQHIRPAAAEQILWHQRSGHRLVLVSANLDVFVQPWAEAAGFHDILSSEVEEDNQGLITGRLIGKNCREEEKVRRLTALLGPKETYCLYAYGNSSGDIAMLQLADYAFYRTF